MDEPNKQTGTNPGNDDQTVNQTGVADNGDVKDASQSTGPEEIVTKGEETLSQQEKIRRAKIALEGFERTVKREAAEKEEQASGEKQEINKLLNKVNHDKELLELTWVNLDDKRSTLKKILEPLLTREEKIESEENQLESKESVSFSPRDRRELEQKRWAIQTERRKLEEEKWIVEERILKIEDQIEDNKKKYQVLLTEEDKLRNKLKEIDEQILLQEEVLRQQRELREQTLRKEALKKAEEDRRRQEAEAIQLAEAKQREEEKRIIEEKKKREEEMRAKAMKEQAEQQKHFEEVRKAEEERQKQETAKIQAAAAELKKKIEAATAVAQQASVKPEQEKIAETELVPKPKTTAESVADKIAAEKEKRQSLKELEEIERIKQENEEAVRKEREKQAETTIAQTSSLIDKLKEEEGLLKPLRTCKEDLEEAMRNQAGGNAGNTAT